MVHLLKPSGMVKKPGRWKMTRCTVVVPEMGAKLVSLADKRSGLEWLAGPADRPFRPVPYGADFVQQDMSGWDEMFPTIVACAYPAPGENHGSRPCPIMARCGRCPGCWNLGQRERCA